MATIIKWSKLEKGSDIHVSATDGLLRVMTENEDDFGGIALTESEAVALRNTINQFLETGTFKGARD